MRKIPAFSVLLLMAAVSVLGLFSLPMLNIQYAPQVRTNTIRVTWTWNDVSARLMEAEVTSKLEGMLSSVSGVTSISSSSDKGKGSINLTFRKKTDMAVARFEIATRIRNLYPSLPEGVTYPSLSLNTRGTGGERAAISYVIKSPLPSDKIRKHVNDKLIGPLSSLDGVERVVLWGATPFELVINFDSDKAQAEGISASEIAAAISDAQRDNNIGFIKNKEGLVSVKVREVIPHDLGSIPVKSVGNRIVHLGDIASWQLKESEPDSYYRINGLNIIQLATYAGAGTNLLKVTKSIRKTMEGLKKSLPPEISFSVSYDSSQYITRELNKIYFRTLLCILILLVFIFLMNRSLRYLLLMFFILMVNILIAIAFYNISGLDIHIYTLAGITVSLGIIIDTSIVMADHYSYYHDRKVMQALFAATATTIAAISVIALLPEQEKLNLGDFCKVIVINLFVALFTAWLFIPSLLDRFPLKKTGYSLSIPRRKRVIRWNILYERYIHWGLGHRWVYVLFLVVSFGIPLCALPDKIGENKKNEDLNFLQRSYNSIMAWKPYADNRKKIDGLLGSSFALFQKAVDRSDFYREPGRKTLYISAGMPEGCSVAQLNDVVKSMENYLAGFDQIELFATEITSYDNARITITFKPEWENTSFPDQLKAEATSIAMNFGGANWRVWGVNDSYFNNNVVSDFKDNVITLRGYNYDELNRYAETLINQLSQNKRVQSPEIVTRNGRNARNEYNISYDFARMASLGISPSSYYSKLYSILYDTYPGNIEIGGDQVRIRLRSTDADRFDLWHIENEQLHVDSLSFVKLSQVGSIAKRHTDFPIEKTGQTYVLSIGYDFLGSYQLARNTADAIVSHMNSEILPIGYKAEARGSGWRQSSKAGHAGLILIAIAIIFVMCSMIFESLRLPFSVIFMIPVAFVGVFLVFGLTDFIFDQGGFASFVTLTGLVVNAGIYLINQWQTEKKRNWARWNSPSGNIRCYVKSFNHKINAIILTIISTVLGIIPFLFEGPKEVFWFAFAAGTISGLIFSIFALIFIFPIFALDNQRALDTIFVCNEGSKQQHI